MYYLSSSLLLLLLLLHSFFSVSTSMISVTSSQQNIINMVCCVGPDNIYEQGKVFCTKCNAGTSQPNILKLKRLYYTPISIESKEGAVSNSGVASIIWLKSMDTEVAN